MTSPMPIPDSPARRNADLSHLVDIFIGDDDGPPDPPRAPAARPCEGPPCAP